MSALATEAVCKYCGRTRVDGAVFERWRQTCTLCRRWLSQCALNKQRGLPPPPRPFAIEDEPAPRPLPQLRASWLARAVDCRQRARLAADLLTARALYDQAADWEALAAQQD